MSKSHLMIEWRCNRVYLIRTGEIEGEEGELERLLDEIFMLEYLEY